MSSTARQQSNSLEAFYLDAPSGGQRFCLLHRSNPAHPQLGRVLYVHPFAEEMNKVRRMAAMQSRALAKAGYTVLQLDLFGCGDSSGDFGDASWQTWLDDIHLGCRHLDSVQSGPLWLWGVRGGALLAFKAAQQLQLPCNFLFWQAQGSGKLALQQFLRLKMAAELASGNAKQVMEKLRQALASGESIEIAGYEVSPSLAQGLETANLNPPPQDVLEPLTTRRVAWLELSTQEASEFSPASEQMISRWRRSGAAVHAEMVAGPSFWQTTEIEDAPALIEASIAAMQTCMTLPPFDPAPVLKRAA